MAPDVSKPFVVRTGALDTSLGEVLLQEEGEVLHPVAYPSRKLSESEKHYSVTESERFALVWAIRKSSLYLHENHFVVQADHQPLECLHTTKHTNSRVMRRGLSLQEYSFHVQYIRGTENVGAAPLSRLHGIATVGCF